MSIIGKTKYFIDVKKDINNETEGKIRDILRKPELVYGLNEYIKIQRVANNTEKEFKNDSIKDYRNFYRMTNSWYHDDFINTYFSILNDLRGSYNKSNLEANFKMILNRLHKCGIKYKNGKINNRYEMSFTSKLLHTVDPILPIWDSVVATKHFGYSLPSKEEKDRENDIPALYYRKYDEYRKNFKEYIADDKKGKILIRLFKEKC